MSPATTSATEKTEAFIRWHQRTGMALIKRATANRRWLRKLAKSNPGAGQFYGEHLDLVMAGVQQHRAYIRQARAKLAAQAAPAEQVAA